VGGQPGPGIEQHVDAVAKLDLDVADVSVGSSMRGVRSLYRVEHRCQKAHLGVGVAAYD
jgi:hypothetical protein